MSRILSNEYVGLCVRIFLGAVFLVACIEKIADPSGFAVSIENYRILPPSLVLVVATGLPWIELLCGLALIFGIGYRGASLLTLTMLVIFTAAVISGLFRGLDISCGCFTQDPNVGKIGWLKVGENAGLLLLAMHACFSTASRFTLERYYETRNRTAT